ncbi:MAG: lipopolysaccharide biosynthesis protein [Pigmentiphaga sp.]|uniref:lipopolysaccharide biosynthesis protein n=1 Tax=Pigmentiphaga sp. TaxID=1977564 RepID=UPI003B546FCE
MRIPKFWRNVATVLTGTVAAQALPLLALPIFTRFLTPSELGTYFVWFGAVSILMVAATGRFDMAVFGAETPSQVLCTIKTGILVGAAIALLAILAAITTPHIVRYDLLPLGVRDHLTAWAVLGFVLAINQLVLAVYVYDARYLSHAVNKTLLAAGVTVAQLLAVWLSLGVEGLIQFHVLAATCITAFLTIRVYRTLKYQIPPDDRRESIRQNLTRNYRFPLIAMPADFINTFAAQLPLFLITASYSSSAAAAYALTLRVLVVPIGLVSGSILTVFKERASTAFRTTGNCRSAYLSTLRTLFLLGLAPFFLAWFALEPAFSLIFGEQWVEAGSYAKILLPMFFMKFIASPLGYTFYITQRQHYDLIWQSSVLIMTWLVFTQTNSINTALAAYSAAYSFLYLVYIALSYRASHGNC